MSQHFVINGAGCALVDHLYKPVSFHSPSFQPFLSARAGDGGLSPGKLVFTEELEKYLNTPYSKAREGLIDAQITATQNIGGPSIVSLIHAAQMLAHLPVAVNYFGCHTGDQAGTYFRQQVARTPVGLSAVKRSDRYTPFTDVLIDPEYNHGNGERIFINNIGAAWDMRFEDLTDEFYQAHMIALGGTALVPHLHERLHDILQKAKQTGAFTVVNTVYDFLNEKKNPDQAWPLGDASQSYGHIDLLIADHEEALRLSGLSDAGQAFEFFQSSGVGAFVITHDAQPVTYWAGGGSFDRVSLSTLPVSARVGREIKAGLAAQGDTTGCGDNFAGGIIAAVATQMMGEEKGKINLVEAVCCGIAAGGFACFYHGGTYYERSTGEKKRKIEDYLNDYKLQEQLFFDRT
jgi:sugar/nucleoside kinase (ribokinase family)